FFQEEDCIRDFHVTGVQTCALPISRFHNGFNPVLLKLLDKYILKRFLSTFVFVVLILLAIVTVIDLTEKMDKYARAQLYTWEIRSEERRVGKVCNERITPTHR